VNADLSVAPEIAQLAAPLALVPSPQRHSQSPSVRLTTGQLATELLRLAAAPQRWWDLVRFDPDQPARIAVPASFEAWLLVIPPGQAAECRCQLAMQIAGDPVEVPGSGAQAAAPLAETAAGTGDAAGTPPSASAAQARERTGDGAGARAPKARPLRQGRVRVHAPGSEHVTRSASHGYSVTLHAGWHG
jgi:hypothetical protein